MERKALKIKNEPDVPSSDPEYPFRRNKRFPWAGCLTVFFVLGAQCGPQKMVLKIRGDFLGGPIWAPKILTG